MAPPPVSAIITNYNSWENTLESIRSTLATSGEAIHEIIVVDDCSTQPPPAELPAKVRLIRNEKNLGYVRSVNVGFRANTSDYILLLDCDAFPKVDVASPLPALFGANPRLGLVCLHTINRHGRGNAAITPEPRFVELLLGRAALKWGLHRGAPVYPSCGLALRRQAVDDVKGFDEDFDFLDADIDFSMRVRRAGWELEKSETLAVLHEGSGHFQTTAKRVVRHYRNRWLLLTKHRLLAVPALAKLLLAGKHAVEYLSLLVFGGLVYKDPVVLADKRLSRRTLLSIVWGGYSRPVKL